MQLRSQLAASAALVLSVAASLLSASVLAAGCTEHGSHPGTGDGGAGGDASSSTGAIRIDPADHEAIIRDGAPIVVDYHAYVRGADGAERDVTAEVSWVSTNGALGAFSGSTFTSGTELGGVTTIRASMGSLEGSTRLTLRLEQVIVTPGTPADAPSRFGGTVDPSRAPEVVYPPDDTMVPPNLGELEFHFRPNGADVFELHVVSAAVDLRIYFGCMESVGGGCVFTPDRSLWEVISTATRGAGPTTYTLRSADSAGRVGESPARTITVAEENITGGLYYWNAAAGRIDRFEFGVRGAVAEAFLDRGRAGAMTCIGCHALSRDGRRIAIGTDIPTTTFQVFDVASRTRIFSQGGGGGIGGFPSQPNFYSFNPDATQIVASSAEGIHFRDGNTGNVTVPPIAGTGPGAMPDWSPDGQHIVYVEHPAPAVGFLYDFSSVQSGSIHTLDFDGSTWHEGATLATGGGNNYYPTYAPDSQWVVFNRSPSNVPSMGADPDTMAYVPDAELWTVRADGSAPPIQLSRAFGLADSWPKFDPTTYQDRGHTVFWLAWSSRRAFGLRYGEGGDPQLWMAAFRPDEAAAGHVEMITPPFRLPFQDITTGNHIAQWVTTVERMTCTSDAQCSGEFCVDGRCYQQPPLF